MIEPLYTSLNTQSPSQPYYNHMEARQTQVLTLDGILQSSETYSSPSMSASFDLEDILNENIRDLNLYDDYDDPFEEDDDSASVTLTKKSETTKTVSVSKSKLEQLRSTSVFVKPSPERTHWVLKDTQIDPKVFTKNVTFMNITNVSKPFEPTNRFVGLPTSIAATSSKFLAVGTSQSSVALFEMGVKAYKLMETVNKNRYGAVTSVDISKDNQLMACGYNNGYLTIWDLGNFSLTKTIQSQHNTESILKVQFVRNNEFISSDLEGNVMIHTIEKYVWTSLKSKRLVNKLPNNAYYDIKSLRLSNGRHSATLVSFNNVVLIGLDPVEALFIFERPEGVPSCIPLADVGNFKIGETEHSFVCISWGPRLYFYEFKPMSGSQLFTVIDNYQHNYNLLSLQILSSTSIILLDLAGAYKIINAISFLQKHPEPVKSEGILKQDLLSAKCQTNEWGKQRNSANTVCKATESFNQMFFITEGGLFRCRFHKWSQMIYYLIETKEYLQALKVAIEIFNDRLDIFSERVEINPKTVLIFNDMITYYLSMRLKEIKNLGDQELREIINTSIEFCLEIYSYDHLFTRVFTLVDRSYHLDRMFLECLEPFIREGLIKRFPNFAMFEKVIDYYAEEEPSLVDVLILSLEPHSIDYFATLNVCVDHQLYRSLLYVSELNGDFVGPANKILEACVKLRDSGGSPQKIEECMSLLYLSVVRLLDGKSFAETILPENIQLQGLSSLVTWMTIEENVTELVNFNGSLYFEVLEKLLTSRKVVEAMEQEPLTVEPQRIFDILRGKVAGDKECQEYLASLMTRLDGRKGVNEGTVEFILNHLDMNNLHDNVYQFIDNHHKVVDTLVSKDSKLWETLHKSIRALILLRKQQYSEAVDLFSQAGAANSQILFKRLNADIVSGQLSQLVVLDPVQTAEYLLRTMPEDVPSLLDTLENSASKYLLVRTLKRASLSIHLRKVTELEYFESLCTLKPEKRVLSELHGSKEHLEEKFALVVKHNLKECQAYLTPTPACLAIYKQLFLLRFNKQLQVMLQCQYSHQRDFKRLTNSIFHILDQMSPRLSVEFFDLLLKQLSLPSKKREFTSIGEQVDNIAHKKEMAGSVFISHLKSVVGFFFEKLASQQDQNEIQTFVVKHLDTLTLRLLMDWRIITLTTLTINTNIFSTITHIIKNDDIKMFEDMLEQKALKFCCKPICRRCSLFLTEGISSSRVFECGHCFHSECLYDIEVCQVCESNRFLRTNQRANTLLMQTRVQRRPIIMIESNPLFSFISFESMVDREKEEDWTAPTILSG